MSRRIGLLLALVAVVGVVAAAWADVAVRAQLSRSNITVGESATLEVTVDGAVASVGEPQFDVPGGLELLGTARAQNMSWVNGRSSTQTTFRFELAGTRAGNYVVGPIRVRVGGQWYESGSVRVGVSSQRQSVGANRGRGPAALIVEASPRDPYVGQPVMLRVRLVQRAQLAEDPSYTPPPTPGFWGERSTQPESYYADEAGSRVLVTETRTRLYPLAAGAATVGSASAMLTIALSLEPSDAFPWLSRPASRREVALQSDPVTVHVRPLPAGAPEGFDGAVGRFTATWRADRTASPQDVPITVWLDVRGVGNLPLLRTPWLGVTGADVFTSNVQDSLPVPGGNGAGRRRFQWTVLPRRPGRLEIAAPALAWFDYESGQYRALDVEPLAVDVGPATRAGAGDGSGFPVVFAEHPVDPFARSARPWGFALGGLLLGIGAHVLLRERRRRRQAAAPAPTWLEGLKHARGTSFLAAADRAVTALAERGVDVSEQRRRVDAARYGGATVNESMMRKSLIERIDKANGPSGGPGWWPWVGGAAAVLGIVAIVLSLPYGGDSRARLRVLAADRAARAGEIDRAAAEWYSVWRAGGHAAGLAARLAWATVSSGKIAEASAWAARGARVTARDDGLSWAIQQIRDAGGLDGFTPVRLPIRPIEWGLLAVVLGIAAGCVRPRWAIALAACAVLAATIPPVENVLAARAVRAVIREPLELEGEGLELAAGHVVLVRERAGDRSRVMAGSHIEGWVPNTGLIPVTGTP